ncbi:hypothetical protein WMY93_021881 [Mugilogobius chulae]|uniref:Nucleolar protein 14 n=1 Tax=Mugilogobius chulae TaxID=88201 RepID=A0AAW0NG89_9GOBI
MAPEDKILQRFAMERQRSHDKKDIYNLNEEEELTHYGQSLAESRNSMMLLEVTKKLKRRVYSQKSSGEQQADEGIQRAKSRQELIEELILKSKQESAERKAQELTEKLDQEWKSIQALMVKKMPKTDQADKPEEKPKLDEYDMMVRELGFEMKAQPSEKLKTPEEIAREEREKLQKLEGGFFNMHPYYFFLLPADRLRRMLGEEADDGAQRQSRTHMSADDLNDGFILDNNDKKTLSYEDGKWNIAEENEEQEEGDDDEEEQGESDEDEEAEEEIDSEEGEDEGEEDGSDEDEEEEEEDGHSDLESEQSDAEEDAPKDESKPKKTLSKEELKAQQEAAKSELPYTFAAPESYKDLKDLLSGHTSKATETIWLLLEYIGDLATKTPPELTTVDKLIPELYGLCQMFPEAACKSMQTIIGDAAHSMEETLEGKGYAPLPTLDMLIYLKVTAQLFPTSDFRHPVTTPALLYISQALTKCPVRSLQDVTVGLVLCCLAVEYISFSKRFLPELVNFLLGILHLAVKEKTSLGYNVVPPFRPRGKHSDLLLLSNPESCRSWSKRSIPLSAAQHQDFSCDLDKDHQRLSCLSTCLDLVKRCSLLYKDLPSFSHIFKPLKTLLSDHLPVQALPELLRGIRSEILEAISSATTVTHARLVFEKKKPIPLKLLTPKIVEILDYGKKRGTTREEREKERLKHKYKKEFKGALREIRKDTRFLAREKLNDVMKKDQERKRKVKELLGSLATQEGEWKALKRKKKK